MRKKVIHIINNLETGGAEKLLSESIHLYSDADYHVDLAVLDSRETFFYKQIKSNGITLINIHKGSLYHPVILFRLIKILRKYDIAHVHLFPAQYWVVLAKIFSFSKIKLIFSEHSTYNKRLYHPLFKWTDIFSYGFYKRIICISEQVKETFISQLGIKEDKFTVVENGINLEDVNQSATLDRSSLGYTDSDRLILMIARFTEEKDHKTLIDSLQYLDKRFKLILVGDGKLSEYYQQYVNERNLKNRISFLGKRTDIYPIIKSCDIVVLSSKFEGFGLSALEGMALKKPVIASDIPGLGDLVRNAGLLFKPGKPEDLANLILSLENEKYYQSISASCYKRAQEYDIKVQVKKIKQLYEIL